MANQSIGRFVGLSSWKDKEDSSITWFKYAVLTGQETANGIIFPELKSCKRKEPFEGMDKCKFGDLVSFMEGSSEVEKKDGTGTFTSHYIFGLCPVEKI